MQAQGYGCISIEAVSGRYTVLLGSMESGSALNIMHAIEVSKYLASRVVGDVMPQLPCMHEAKNFCCVRDACPQIMPDARYQKIAGVCAP